LNDSFHRREGTWIRLGRETLAIATREERRTSVLVPTRAVLLVNRDLGRFVEVIWNDEPVLMFEADLRERSHPLAAAASG
jgi:hypothetical protein